MKEYAFLTLSCAECIMSEGEGTAATVQCAEARTAMQFRLLGEWGTPYFELPVRAEGYLLLAILVILLLWVLIRRRKEFTRLSGRQWLLFVSLLLAAVVLSNVLDLRLPSRGLPTVLGQAREPRERGLPLLASVPILLAATWLGMGPATIVAFASGLVRGAFESYRLLQPFEVAIFGLAVAFFIRQEYRGLLGSLLRQPLVAALMATCVSWAVLFVSFFVYYVPGPTSILVALNYCWTVLAASMPASLVEAALAGLLLQALYWIFPTMRAVRQAHRVPPYGRSLNLRFLFLFVPLVLVIIATLFYAVTVTAVKVADRQVLTQVVRDALNGSERIPLFFQNGQALLTGFAQDEDLRSEDSLVQQARLERDMRSVAFFDRLMLIDADMSLLSSYPSLPPEEKVLSEEEKTLAQRTIQVGAPQVSPVHYSPRDELVLSFIVPVEGPELGGARRALLGRVAVGRNPTLQGIVLSLQRTMGAGEGFIVDEEGRIVAYPSGKNFQPLSRWTVADSPRRVYQTEQGLAYEDVSGVGTREIVYYLPVEGHSWSVIIRVPYSVVLAQATEISTPLLLILVMVALVSFAAIPLLTHRLTHPLQDLAAAAGQIASGRLEVPVRVSGEDEVGRLGTVFEQMRIRLQERLAELSLLLEVSQAVSRSLDLEVCLSPILKGALRGTSAKAARIVILSDRREVEKAVALGQGGAAMAHFDQALAAVARADSPFIASDLTRARGTVPAAVVQAGIHAAIGLPLRIQGRTTGVMWVGYAEPHQFTEAELGFLSTLAGQAAVVAENARLFEAAESERRRLAAILSSTADAIIVTDSRNRIVLINPAAEQIYGIVGSRAVGMPLTEAIADEPLHDLFARALNAEGGLAEEVPSPDGRVLYASVSPISGAEGQIIGRVAVMRDITYLKELDNMKSEFVATVSHDLRSPLTFMRGYTTMISMVGQVTPKQEEFIRKILGGIDQMTALIDDLLDIGKIEAGIGVDMGPCRLQAIVLVAVDSLRARAEAKGLRLDLNVPDDLPPMIGDEVLLRQAVTNLVDNAIKYTPAPGTVEVGITTQDDYLVIWVKDSGIGIAPADQRRLFEKFYRIKRRDTIAIKGTGLGLAIVKSIVERHHGRVWVESQLGKGSTFYIALPQAQPESPAKDRAQGETP